MAEEVTIYEGKIPFKVAYFSHPGLWFLLWGWNVGLLSAWLQTFEQTLKITTQRIIVTTGILSKKIEEVEFDRVDDTAYQQRLLDRLVGIGTITLMSGDKTAPLFSFSIHNPADFREQIRESIKQERRRMRAIPVREDF